MGCKYFDLDLNCLLIAYYQRLVNLFIVIAMECPFNRIHRLFTHNQMVAECQKYCIRAILDGRIEVGARQIVSGLSTLDPESTPVRSRER